MPRAVIIFTRYLDIKSRDYYMYIYTAYNYNLGNNLYGDDIKHHLEKIKNSDERSAYVLMERIFPWPQKNHLLKVGKDSRLRDVISELGIFGVYLG